jgi:5S rRNA maturation endonuclease (ribonuclease M5)
MASRAELAALDTALVEIVSAYRPMTVRGAFYQAVGRRLVPKDETKGYRLVQRRLLKLREAGQIPYGWITDGSRAVYGHIHYRDAEEFVRTVKTRYRQDYWAEADEYVEIWIEKEALAGVIKPVVISDFGLDLYVTRGFASVTYLQQAAEDIAAEGRPVYVYLLTDFDPYGRNIAEKVEEELAERSCAEVYVQRVAVTLKQIEELNLPTRPTKQSKRKEPTHYEATHGAISVELDAIPPDELRYIVAEYIERHMNQRRLQQKRMVERQEREGLARLLPSGGGTE